MAPPHTSKLSGFILRSCNVWLSGVSNNKVHFDLKAVVYLEILVSSLGFLRVLPPAKHTISKRACTESPLSKG